MNFILNQISTKEFEGLIWVILASFLARYVSEYFFVFDLFNHLKIPIAIVFILLLIMIVIRKKYLNACIYFILALIINVNAIPSSPVIDGRVSDNSLKIVQFNLYVRNDNVAEVVASIVENNPDIISFQEVTPYWETHLKDNLKQYDFYCQSMDSPFGICVASKLQIDNPQVVYLISDNIPSIEFTTEYQGVKLNVFSTHPPPPFIQSFFNYRNKQFDELVKNYRDRENFILIGDLNITQWSPIYEKLESDLNLKNTLSPYDNTWHAILPIRIFQLDHILIDKRFKIVESKVLESIGSDHLPIYAEIAISGQE